MANPNQRDPHRGRDDDLHETSHHEVDETTAADEPTAVWDAEALREAGLSELLEQRDSAPTVPATPALEARRDPSVVIAADALPAAKTNPQAAPSQTPGERLSPPRKELGWGAAVALAVVLGGIVYALIRYLR